MSRINLRQFWIKKSNSVHPVEEKTPRKKKGG